MHLRRLMLLHLRGLMLLHLRRLMLLHLRGLMLLRHVLSLRGMVLHLGGLMLLGIYGGIVQTSAGSALATEITLPNSPLS